MLMCLDIFKKQLNLIFKEASIYRGRSLSPFYATNSSEETSTQSKQQESEGMKKRIKRKVEKESKQDAIPEVNLTKKEEFEQVNF